MKYFSFVIIGVLFLAFSLKNDKKLVLSSGKVKMVIDPQVSGRIISFAYGGINILTGNEVHPENYGSTLWPAPQSIWHWPPYEVLDKNPYQVIRHTNGEILLQSKPDSVSGLQFTKHFVVKDDHFLLKYSIKNISVENKEVAAWEVTRVDTSGRAFFPLSGEAELDKSSLQNIENKNNYLWYYPDYENMENSQKYYGYGKDGYLAWATGNLLFVKSFPDINPAQPAPGQAEIEIFAHSEYPYIELENHGPYRLLNPGETLDYEVKWYLRKISKQMKEEQIIKLAESLIE